MRLIWIFVTLGIIFLVPFLIWGESWQWTSEGAVAWLRNYGTWAWAVALGLLAADLFLPLPATAVMAALGFVYGPVVGGLIGGTGSLISGCLAYGLCRALGRGTAIKLVGADDLVKGERLFEHFGGWLVTLSRWLPLFPEVVACMAGLTRMPWSSFLIAMVCGCFPMAFTFAFVGHTGVEHPALAIGLSAIVPPILWFLIQRFLTNGKKGSNPE
jgi:uncharacterized membrane protein YdjX (TVP38/TMEM64 family)